MEPRDLCARIRSMAVAHPTYERCLALTYSHLAIAQEGSVVALVGPTRVGKTTLTNAVMVDLARPHTCAEGSIPIVRVDATTTDQGFMSTKYLKLRLLEELRHPGLVSVGTYHPRLSLSESSAQLMLNKAIRALGTRFIVIDESHHLLETKSSRLVGSALDNIKCLGNECGVVVLLSGSYRLLSTCFESAHLNGRLTLVNFNRYRPMGVEAEHFDSILLTMDERLPWAGGESLIKHRDLIYEGSLGCYGLIEGWVLRAIATMAGCGDRRLKVSHFTDSRCREQLGAIRDEIRLGESLITPLSENDRSPKMPASGANKHVRRSPGVRSSVRDRVGGTT